MIKIQKCLAIFQKNAIYIIGIGFILFLIIFRGVYLSENDELNNYGNKTICKIYYSAWLPGQGRYICKYIYFVQDKKHFGLDVHYNNNCYIGDFYKISYLSSNPNTNRIYLNQKISEKDVAKYFPPSQNPFETEIKQDSIKRLRGN